jgi:ribonuclease HI
MADKKSVLIYTDGGSRGNPGPSAIGVYMVFPNGKTIVHGDYIGEATNNVAEYTALRLAIKLAVAAECKLVLVRADSELMVNQMRGLYLVKDEKIKKLYDEIVKLLPKFDEFAIHYVPREENTEADRLVNVILDKVTKKKLK